MTVMPIYAVSSVPEERDKQQIAEVLLTKDDLAVSAQVMGEFYVQTTRPSRPEALRHDEAVEIFSSLRHSPEAAENTP